MSEIKSVLTSPDHNGDQTALGGRLVVTRDYAQSGGFRGWWVSIEGESRSAYFVERWEMELYCSQMVAEVEAGLYAPWAPRG